jgi:hypothetical protein
MDKNKKKKMVGIGVIAAIGLLAFVILLASAASDVTRSINYQGRLADSAGNPLSGTYSMAFKLYETSTGGTALTTRTSQVVITNGLFNTNIDLGTTYFDGRALWLGITVGSDSEMTPRQQLRPVPYALSLRPGAKIISSTYPALHAESTHPSGRGIRGYATATSGTNYGVVGASGSPDGYGTGGTGVYGKGAVYGVRGKASLSSWEGEFPPPIYGVYGETVDLPGFGTGVYGRANTGVRGYGTTNNGVVGWAAATGGRAYGVYAVSMSPDGAGVYAMGKDSGADLILAGNADTAVGDDGRIYSDPNYASSDIWLIANDGVRIDLDNNGDGEDADFEICDKDNNRIFNVDESGQVYADGSFHSGGADIAEYFSVDEDPEPGTVLVIGKDSKLQCSTTAYDTTVAGIVSTSPGVSLGTNEEGNESENLIAVAGRVPCKVDASYAPIKPGDLLTTSDTPGYAMKATKPQIGTILGKALEPLDSGRGVIEVLVTLQ